jgi:hypothetical protein
MGTDYCDSLSYLEKGNKWTLTNYNKKGKVEGHVNYSVLDKRNTDGVIEWDLRTKMEDDKGEELNDITTTVTCDGNAVQMDMSQMIPQETMEGLASMDLEIEADDVVYPFQLKENTELPQAQVTLRASTGGVQVMEITTIIKDRKVEKMETISTQAGDFEAFKITQTTEVKNSFISRESKSIDWYCPKIGVVRSEYYDKKGKLDGYSEITSFTKG